MVPKAHSKASTPVREAAAPTPPVKNHSSIYSLLHSASGFNFTPAVQRTNHIDGGIRNSPPPAPVRDASSLKAVRYGPGHEKFPSWPGEVAPRSNVTGGSTRSKSWTEHTNYPKEQPPPVSRPYNRRVNPAFTQQLKTVMERCEKIPPETYESTGINEGNRPPLYLPRLDRDGKILGDSDYSVPSPPERDLTSKPQLTQADLEEYARSYEDTHFTQLGGQLTRAELEQYSRAYDDASLRSSHQTQNSYAQSEGYHSYVSSTDSTTTTPFLDRLRRDSEAVGDRTGSEDIRVGRESSASSGSSSETLKWHGSLSDVSSLGSSSCNTHHQLIAHSARVQTPQRHHSESVLYLGGAVPQWNSQVQRNNQLNNQMRRLFPVSTYTVQPTDQASPRCGTTLTVAERISELERQQQIQPTLQQPQPQSATPLRYAYHEGERRSRVTDHASLKAIQKKALLSFYERHHSTWKSEPQLGPSSPHSGAPPQPPPRPRPLNHSASRRSSSASDYACSSWREMLGTNKDSTSNNTNGNRDVSVKHQHSSSCGSLSTSALGPLIVGPAISVDDWVPARPPKKPHLRAAYPPPRMASPDLPPPSPPPVIEDEVFVSDEPLPPPPSEDQLPDWASGHSSDVRLPKTYSHVEGPPVISQKYGNSQSHEQKLKSSSKLQLDKSNMNTSLSLDNLTKSSDIKINSNYILDRSDTSPVSPASEFHFENQPDLLRHIDSKSVPRDTEKVNYVTTQDKEKALDRLLERKFEPGHIEEHRPSKSVLEWNKGPQRQRSVDSYFGSSSSILKEVEINNDQKFLEIKVSQDRRSAENLLQSNLTDSWKNYDMDQPKSLDSNLSIIEDHQQSVNKPGPQTPVDKKHVSSPSGNSCVLKPPSGAYTKTPSDSNSMKPTYRCIREHFMRSASVRMDVNPLHFNGENSNVKPDFMQPIERKSLRFSTTQKLLVNGKIANAVQNGRTSPPPRKFLSTSQLPRKVPNNVPAKMSLSTGCLKLDGSLSGFTKPIPAAESADTSEKEESLVPSSPPQSGSVTSAQISQSKASYIAYRREPRDRDRGIPNFEGSYKRTMSPSGCHILESPESTKDKLVTEDCSTEENTKQCVQSETEKVPPSHENLTDAQNSASLDNVEISKTLPRNYSSPSANPTKRPSRSSRTQSDPVNASQRENFEASLHVTKADIGSDDKKETISSDVCERLNTAPSPSVSVSTSISSPVEDEEEKELKNITVSDSDRTVNNCDEPLRLVQRTEVTLRVNATTSDASSQTEASTTPSPSPVIVSPQFIRRPLQEEIECEQLSRDLASQLSPTHRLQGILAPGPEVKRSTDYVSGLFRMDVTPRTRVCVTSNNLPPTTSPSSNTRDLDDNIATQSLSANSAYFTTSECKAKLMALYSQSQPDSLNGISNLHQKKEELMARLTRKLNVLRSEAIAVSEESRVNDALGFNVEDRVGALARPHEASKFRLHVKEVGHITSLLLGLSGRLARAENALLGLSEDHEDRKTLESKRDKLRAQLEEAKELKANIDRRSSSVSAMLYRYLTAEEYADYDHFINMKAKLLIDSREIADKIQLGEEQLAALKETMIESR